MKILCCCYRLCVLAALWFHIGVATEYDSTSRELNNNEVQWFREVCGNQRCRGQETCQNCPVDCGACPEPPSSWSGSSLCFGQAHLPCTTDADCGWFCDRGRYFGMPCAMDRQCSGHNARCTVMAGSCWAPPSSPSPPPPLSFCDTRPPMEILVTSAADIANALSECGGKPGDVLIMANGTWRNQIIRFVGKGTAQAPVVLRAQTPGQVILTGSSRLQMAGEYLVVNGLRFQGGTLTNGQKVIEFRTSSSSLASFSRLTNTAIINYNPSVSLTDYDWIGMYGTNNRVDHCAFVGKNHKGPLLVVWRPTNAADFHQIDHNYFADFASGNGQNEWETIRIGTSTNSLSNSSSLVQSNFFHRCNGEIEIISVKAGDNILRYNTFDSCQGMLTLRHGRANRVEGNFFLGKGVPDSGGIRLIDSHHVVINNYLEGLTGRAGRAALVLANGLFNSTLKGYFAAQHVTVAFNTIYHCREALRIGWRSKINSEKVRDSILANNVIESFFPMTSSTDSTTRSIIVQEDPPVNLVYQGNYVHGGPGASNLGIASNAGIIETDPNLIRAEDGLMRPAPDSPLMRSAVALYNDDLVSLDMDGQVRRGAKTVGADQVVGSTQAIRRRPFTEADVGRVIGPSWWRWGL